MTFLCLFVVLVALFITVLNSRTSSQFISNNKRMEAKDSIKTNKSGGHASVAFDH